MKRAIRRHHTKRLMEKRKSYYDGSNKVYYLIYSDSLFVLYVW